ncbi:MAG TPA: M20/M25/M40 family metallo-hydrolase, partial [Gammaproteobacteria bacterium]|nr:M20/M25/M40 family metallo-hydrolase [Gammaproteobacteria bacterium]
MKLFPHCALALFFLLLSAPAYTADQQILPADLKEEAIELRDAALDENRAYGIVASLTTEVGPRLAGSAGDKAAVAWALNKLRDLGFENVRAVPVQVPHWVRGDISVEITSPWPQELTALALGGSIGTSEAGIEAPIIAVENLAELHELSTDEVKGKIVFIHGEMKRTKDGSGYGEAGPKRWVGAAEAAKLGAVGLLIRSVGTDNNATPHTGSTSYEKGVRKIPAAALSNPDADLLERQLASGRPVTVNMTLSARYLPDAMSANVIGEIPGETDEIVLLAAHLDSWDVGTGAHDDGAGVAIVTAAARQVKKHTGTPLRTIRVVLFANEEFGLSGARAYAKRHADDVDKHVLAMEADLGGFRVWQFNSYLPKDKVPVAKAVAELLKPLGVEWGHNHAHGGADIGPLMDLGVPVFGPQQDATYYFDLHHTENDTLDKIDPKQLSQNVA